MCNNQNGIFVFVNFPTCYQVSMYRYVNTLSQTHVFHIQSIMYTSKYEYTITPTLIHSLTPSPLHSLPHGVLYSYTTYISRMFTLLHCYNLTLSHSHTHEHTHSLIVILSHSSTLSLSQYCVVTLSLDSCTFTL